MLKVALTGNIASGKSTVQRFLETFGYKVLDTDKVGHELLNTLPEIKEQFSDFIQNDGTVNREKLGKAIFHSQELKTKLEQILHPAIKSKILEFFEQNKSETLTFVGIPLLFETNMQDIFDKAVLIYTDDITRKKRLIERNNYTSEYADIRMNSQLSQDEKKLLCDFIIYNNGTLSDLEKYVNEFLNQIKH